MNLLQTFQEKERQYGLPSGYLARTAQVESSMNPRAKNPNSSAGGLFQFIDDTAAAYGLRNRYDPLEATDAAARLARDNGNALRRALGREPTAGELYLAHQQGSGGAIKMLRNPDASAASVVGDDAAGLNGGAGLTAGQMAQKWTGKFDGGQGQGTLYGGAGNDDLSGGSMPQNPMPTNPGGLGGLGGFVRSPAFGDWLTAVGTSMMSSGSDAPLENFGTAFANQQALRSRRDAAAEEREDRQRNRQALELALRSQGFTAEEAAAYSTSPQAASVAASGKEAQQARAQENQTLAWLRREHPDLADEVQAGLPITEGLRIASGRRNATGESAEVAERRNIAIANGIDPNTEEGQRYILTGNLPAGDKGVTAGDRQAIREADDLSRDGESVYGLLDEALKLSPDAYEGYSAGVRTSIGNNLPDWLVPDVIADPKTAETTRNYDNIITTQALGSLKSIFGGAPTEGERAILLDVQGMSSQPKNVREAIIKRAKDAVRRRVEFNRDRASELRGGTYYRPRDAAAPAPTAAPIVPGSDADPLGLR